MTVTVKDQVVNTVEEVEAGFEIEEMEAEDEDLDISADDVPMFKERDRH